MTWIVSIIATLSVARSVSMVWPEVLPVHRTFAFVHPGQNGADTPASLFVISVDGDTAYKMDCHNGNYDDDSEINFSGDFQCALFALQRGVKASANLLADSSRDQQTSDWLFNRGRILAIQLWGQCGTYAEYGLVRHFRVRGMRVTLEFGNLRWSTVGPDKSQLDQFTVDLSVVADSSANSETAQVVEVSRPPRGCGW
ncbi:MAG TPA: hypothetical protein VNV25_22320 [Gemmatimonadaceae bacterium]|nr:hypothetical protein [Gemmatimonadaceae bacterium]